MSEIIDVMKNLAEQLDTIVKNNESALKQVEERATEVATLKQSLVEKQNKLSELQKDKDDVTQKYNDLLEEKENEKEGYEEMLQLERITSSQYKGQIKEKQLDELKKKYEEALQKAIDNDKCCVEAEEGWKGEQDLTKQLREQLKAEEEENLRMYKHILMLEDRLKVAHRISPEEQYKGNQKRAEQIKEEAKKDRVKIASYINYVLLQYPNTKKIDMGKVIQNTQTTRSVIYDFVKAIKEGEGIAEYSKYPYFISWIREGGKFTNTK